MSKNQIVVLAAVVGVAFGAAGIGAALFHSQVARAEPEAGLEKSTLAEDEKAVAAHIKTLHDPDSATRAAAAEALRRIVAKYPSGTVYLASKDGGEAAWREKLKRIKLGMSKPELLKVLPPFLEPPDEMEISSGGSTASSYRLDYQWTVGIGYRDMGGSAKDVTVISQPVLTQVALQIDVAAPKNFTGAWTTWHVNGQKGFEVHYKDGDYDGVLTSYHDNGAKSCEQHYANHVAEGTDTGWYPDGKLQYAGQYHQDEKDGKWSYWYANGNKRSESNYDNGNLNGRSTSWYENGQISLLDDYKQGVRNGIEASWEENGTLNYKRRHVGGKIVE